MVLLAPVGDGGILLTRHRYPQLLNDERSKRTVAQRSHFKANRFNSNSQGWLCLLEKVRTYFRNNPTDN